MKVQRPIKSAFTPDEKHSIGNIDFYDVEGSRDREGNTFSCGGDLGDCWADSAWYDCDTKQLHFGNAYFNSHRDMTDEDAKDYFSETISYYLDDGFNGDELVHDFCEALYSSRQINSSQKGFENIVEGTQYDDYHIDTKGMGILSVENIIEEIEGRGNQAVLTVQTSDGSTNHSQFGSKDWKEYKDSVNDAGNAITDVWVTEVEGSSYVRNSHKIISGLDPYLCCPNCGEPELFENIKEHNIKCYNCGNTISYDELKNLKKYVSPHSKITSARYIATDPETGEVLGSADTYEEAVNEWGEDVTITDSEATEGQEDMGLFQSRRPIKSEFDKLDRMYVIDVIDNIVHYHNKNLTKEQYYLLDDLLDKLRNKTATSDDCIEVLTKIVKYHNKNLTKKQYYLLDDLLEEFHKFDNDIQSSRKITSAVDGGWEVRSSDVPEALDLFVEYFGEEDALEEIAKAMGDDVLQENIEWIAQHWGFAEEIEGLDVWEQYEMAKEYMGVSELFNNLTQAAGYDELAADLAFIFRMNDFREWDKYDNEDDKDEVSDSVTSSKKPETTKQFVTRILSELETGEITEDEAAEEIAEANDVNIGYARQILSSYIADKDRYITSGMLELGDALNVEFDTDGNLDSWSVDFATDPEKPAPTLGGELVRAARYIISAFRDNDEKVGWGYAREVLNPAARFIVENTDYKQNDVFEDLLDGQTYNDDAYRQFIDMFETDFADYLRDHEELFHKLNKKSFEENVNDEDEYSSIDYFSVNNEHVDYWFKYEDGQYVCDNVDPVVNQEWNEGDIITAEDFPFDSIDFNEEYGTFDYDDGYIYSWEDGDGESVRISNVEYKYSEFEEGDVLTPDELENLAENGYEFHDTNGNEIRISDIM